MRDYNIESDLKQEKFEVIKLVQGDKGNKLTINVLEDGKPVSLTGCSITAKYKRADGQVINGSVTNISNNSFDAVIDSDITKVVGTLKMLFSIEKDDVKVSTFLLLADVREGLLENTGSSGGSTGGGEVEPTPNTYTITNTLSNATNSNTATSIEGGSPYSANISVSTGYKIKSITVTMGGINVTSTAVSGNTISIRNVTGNIVITVTTETDTDTVVGNVDSNNNISLTGLSAGTYTLKYEDDNGVLTDFDVVTTMEVK